MDIIKKTMDMKSWAVVGASNKQDKFGYKILKSLKNSGYKVYPINPRLEEIEGIKSYKSILDIKEEIDVVDMVINPRFGIKVMEEIKKKGIKYVWLQPGTRSDEIREFAKKNNIILIEDCIYARLS